VTLCVVEMLAQPKQNENKGGSKLIDSLEGAAHTHSRQGKTAHLWLWLPSRQEEHLLRAETTCLTHAMGNPMQTMWSPLSLWCADVGRCHAYVGGFCCTGTHCCHQHIIHVAAQRTQLQPCRCTSQQPPPPEIGLSKSHAQPAAMGQGCQRRP